MALLFGALQLLSVVRPQIAGKCRQHQVLVHQLSGCSTLSCARKKCQQMQTALGSTQMQFERPGNRRVRTNAADVETRELRGSGLNR